MSSDFLPLRLPPSPTAADREAGVKLRAAAVYAAILADEEFACVLEQITSLRGEKTDIATPGEYELPLWKACRLDDSARCLKAAIDLVKHAHFLLREVLRRSADPTAVLWRVRPEFELFSGGGKIIKYDNDGCDYDAPTRRRCVRDLDYAVATVYARFTVPGVNVDDVVRRWHSQSCTGNAVMSGDPLHHDL